MLTLSKSHEFLVSSALFHYSLLLTPQFNTSNFTSANVEMMPFIQFLTPFHSRMSVIIKYLFIFILFCIYDNIIDYVKPRRQWGEKLVSLNSEVRGETKNKKLPKHEILVHKNSTLNLGSKSHVCITSTNESFYNMIVLLCILRITCKKLAVWAQYRFTES